MKFEELIYFKPIKFDLLLQNLTKFNADILLLTDPHFVPLTADELKCLETLTQVDMDIQLRSLILIQLC